MAEKKLTLMERLEQNPHFKLYCTYLKQAGIKINPLIWIVSSVIIALVAAVLVLLILSVLKINEPIFPFLAFIVIVDVLLGFPYLKANARIERIERDLPDALRQISDTLKAGATYESALREVAISEYGALSEEMQKVLRKLEEGENFENSLTSLSENINSRLVKRTVTIIIDSVRAGAGLAEILDDIAEDIRETYQIGVERKVKTLLQFLFIVAAGAVIAPAIFGIITEVVSFLIKVATSTRVVEDPLIISRTLRIKGLIVLLVEIYVFIEALASSAMISLMRNGRLNKSIIYFPILLLIAFICFFAGRLLVSGMLLQLGGSMV